MMHFTIGRETAIRALSEVAPVIEPHNSIPILANVKIAATETEVAFSAADLDIYATATAAIRGSQWPKPSPGETTAPGQSLLKFLKATPKGSEVEFQEDEKGLTIRAARARAVFPTLASDEFPVGSEPLNPACDFTMPAGTLARELGRVSHAISTEETRDYLNGVYFHSEDGHLRLVATDGHRMGVSDLPAVKIELPGVILPSKTVRLLVKSLTGSKEQVSVKDDIVGSFIPAKAVFTHNGLRLVSRLINGQFPDYTRIIPTGNENTLIVRAREASEAIKRLVALSGKNQAVALKLTTGGTIELSVSGEGGEVTETIDGQYRGPFRDMIVGFNARYLLETLAACGEEIHGHFADPASPALFTSPDSPDYREVLMPLRV